MKRNGKGNQLKVPIKGNVLFIFWRGVKLGHLSGEVDRQEKRQRVLAQFVCICVSSSGVSSGCFYLGMNTYIGCTCVYVLERGEIRPPIWGRWTGKKGQRVLTEC